ncbi:hypothetical protein ANOM_009029 [Aspergillus nomiae NRRL 13137]|uniref:Uncharacterized protein n=1 Tax=Aspergillus nomiae NRRL (strain ATCC 15546 / NRRL 13137 / CBS 260.88 / M93) TaxID=1509407 RepID=A0A0L1IRW0_ASPN3|nr:uncharacterized protein ANOM_009029 [Aspergillus nomiae NRRL 13137]KNG82326.1 hypothetical protein ANOM_009029 [Aspergillus nomiae NRRL 13137]
MPPTLFLQDRLLYLLDQPRWAIPTNMIDLSNPFHKYSLASRSPLSSPFNRCHSFSRFTQSYQANLLDQANIASCSIPLHTFDLPHPFHIIHINLLLHLLCPASLRYLPTKHIRHTHTSNPRALRMVQGEVIYRKQ